MSRATIAKIESGLRKTLRSDEIAVLARVFGVPPGDLTAPAAAEGHDHVLQGLPDNLEAAPGARPWQLPADIENFTGREPHVDQLCTLLLGGQAVSGSGAVRIAVVTGAAGLGKTTLAVHAAHQVKSQFPDGQLYADLLGASSQPALPGEVLARFLRDLGVEGDKVPAGDDERAALYRTRLTGRRVLVLLDNAKDAAQVRPLLPGSASCAVLVTTRSRMPDLATTRFVELNVFEDAEALALFSRIVGEERAAAEPNATAEVLVACAGLPLAIRICAARLAARQRWRIATLADRLRGEHRRLDELRTGDLAVRVSFQVSYASLKASGHDVDPARAFRLLGLWQGISISLPAAAALVGAPEDDVADALETLVDVNLLESPAPDRYRFHDLLRVYATERAQEEEPLAAREEAVNRLLRWYLDTAEAAADLVAPRRYRVPREVAANSYPPLAFTRPEEALAWYDTERGNIVTATRQAAEAGLHDIAWRLPPTLFPMFNRRDNWAECVTAHRVVLESARMGGDRLGEAWVLHTLGWSLARLREEEAFGYLEQALAIRRELGDTRGEAQTAIGLGEGYLKVHGPGEDALRYLHLALELLEPTGATSLHAATLNNLGEVYFELGDLAAAEECYIRARDLIRDVGGYAEGYVLCNLGLIYQALRRFDEAAASYEEALRSHRASGTLFGEAITLKHLGEVHVEAGSKDRGRACLTEALRLFEQIGDQSAAVDIRSALAADGTVAPVDLPSARSMPPTAAGPGIRTDPMQDELLEHLGSSSDRMPLGASGLRFRILGPLEVWAVEWTAITAPRWRSLLALLLLNAGKTVAIDELISEIWEDDPPAQAANLISIYAHRLRRLIGDTDGKVLAYRPPGYQLRISKTEIDSYLFENLVKNAKEALDHAAAATAVSALTEALGLWHGSVLADLPQTPAIKAEAERLERLRSVALQLHAEASAAASPQD